VDRQIGVRGVGIEPAEVEAALRAHPAVTNALVLQRGAELVAYMTGPPGRPAAVPARPAADRGLRACHGAGSARHWT
jgi:hypothetical protein